MASVGERLPSAGGRTARPGDQGVERRVGQQVERERQAVGRPRGRTVVGRDRPHLARPDGEPSGVERLRRAATGRAASPYQDSSITSPSGRAAPATVQAGGCRAGVHDEVAVARRVGRAGRSRRRAPRRPPPALVDVDQLHRAPGMAASSRATQQPTMPAPTTAIRSPTSGAASQSALTAVSTVPASTARVRRAPVGYGRHRAGRHDVAVWCGYRQKTVRPSSAGGPLLHDPDVEVAVLDRAGEVAVLERCAHQLVLARRHPAAEDQRLRAPADPGAPGADQDIVRSRLGQPHWRISPTPGRRSQNARASARHLSHRSSTD